MKKINFLIVVNVLIVQFSILAQDKLQNYVISNGAVSMKNNVIHLAGSIGQTVIGNCNSANLKNQQGFWNSINSLILSDKEYDVDIFKFNFFPNPVLSKLSIEFDLDESKPIQISVCNILGVRVKYFENSIWSIGHNALTFDLEDIAPGIYFIQLVNEESKFSYPFSKVNSMY